jgi:pimeloyl-ACP methyl ester carboxylesterase
MTEFLSTASGDRVAFERVGAAGDPVVLFVAGAGPHRATDPITRPTAELLAGHGIASILFDRLGRGESVADGVLGLDRELGAVAALLETAARDGAGPAVLCGHSSGCAISVAAAVRGLPVAGLVLWEGPFKPPGSGTDAWAAEFGRLLDAGDPEAAQVLYMRDMPPEWLEGARRSPAWPAIVAQAGSLRADAEALAWAESAPHAELFAGISVPTIAVVGEQTPPMMPAAAADIAASIRGAESRVIAGANHAWQPEAMAELLTEFVGALRP